MPHTNRKGIRGREAIMEEDKNPEEAWAVKKMKSSWLGMLFNRKKGINEALEEKGEQKKLAKNNRFKEFEGY